MHVCTFQSTTPRTIRTASNRPIQMLLQVCTHMYSGSVQGAWAGLSASRYQHVLSQKWQRRCQRIHNTALRCLMSAEADDSTSDSVFERPLYQPFNPFARSRRRCTQGCQVQSRVLQHESTNEVCLLARPQHLEQAVHYRNTVVLYEA